MSRRTERVVGQARRLFTEDAFHFQWFVFGAGVLVSLAYAALGVASASAVAEMTRVMKPWMDLLGSFGLQIRRPPIDGALPKDAYLVMTGIQVWVAIAYAVGLVARLWLTRRPLSEPRKIVIDRLMAQRGFSRVGAEVAFHLLCGLLVVLGVFFSWCLLNGLHGYFVFRVDAYRVLPIPALAFVLPGALALPMWLGLVENLARDAKLVYGHVFRRAGGE